MGIAQKNVNQNSVIHYSANYQEERYINRTRRNHFWIGGLENQRMLRDFRVGVAGLGGMGSHIAEHLVRLGVGGLKVADPDTIEETNLNRQAIANRNTIGMTKVDASIQELRGIAEDFELYAFPEGITEENADEFVSGCDVIVNEIDVFPLEAHVFLHRAARRAGVPVYSALSVGMGTHFYKFQGNEYKFEDFLAAGPEIYRNPSAEYLLELFAHPKPSYLNQRAENGFKAEIETGGTPILGASTLLGHSAVVMRILVDRFGKDIEKNWGLQKPMTKTPIMPNFLKLDLGELTLQIARMPDRTRSE